MSVHVLEIARDESPALLIGEGFEGVRVLGVLDGADALEQLQVDVVLLHDGAADVAVVTRMCNAPVIFVHPNPTFAGAVAAMKDGAVDVVTPDAVPSALEEHAPEPEELLDFGLSEEGTWLLHADLIERERLATLGELATGLAHSVNNPAAWVVTNHNEMLLSLKEIEALLKSSLEAAEAHAPGPRVEELRAQANSAFYPQTFVDLSDMISENLDGMKRIRDIVNNLKGFRGATEDEEHKVMEVGNAVQTAAQMARAQAKLPVDLRLDLQVTPPIMGAPPRLAQAFLHIIINSLQSFSEESRDREVVVSTRYESGEVRVEVRDNGAGIPERILPRVFDPFFTVHEGKGALGLGLAICRDIVSHHGGEVEIDSVEGRGTTVTFRLPVPKEHRPREEAPAESAVNLPRLLVVDDEPPITRALRRLLRGVCRVVVANSHAEAIERLSKREEEPSEQIAGVITDLSLGDATGMELAEYIAREHPTLISRTLYMTGGATSDEARAFVERNAAAIVEKPFESDPLRERIASMMSF